MTAAIETSYQGYRFRSRLEARWAVAFDALDIRWEYEIEGFRLDDGRSYLPDFYLPKLDAFVEIKPNAMRPEEEAVARGLAIGSGKRVFGFCGEIPWPDTFGWLRDGARLFLPDGTEDSGYFLTLCGYCAAPGIEYDGRWGRIDCGCYGKLDRDADHGLSPKVIAAYLSARSARFEHGQKPQLYSSIDPAMPEIPNVDQLVILSPVPGRKIRA